MSTVKLHKNSVKPGDQFGRLTVTGTPFRIKKWYQVVCKCNCGNIVVVMVDNIKKGSTTSCGCYATSKTRARFLKHGLKIGGKQGKLYTTWLNIKSRCMNRNNKSYPDYGGRGITVCKEWIESVESFVSWAMSHGYREELEIDRIDNDKGYFPDNCRWVTRVNNSRNKRNNRVIEAFGEKKCLADFAEDSRCIVSYDNLKNRLRAGWNPEKAMTTKTRKMNAKRH